MNKSEQIYEAKSHIKRLINQYQMSFIPVREQFNEKTGAHEGKISAIKGWQNYCKDLPTDEEVDSWDMYNVPTGIWTLNEFAFDGVTPVTARGKTGLVTKLLVP